MKKWYRIGICLVLSACLLLLSACGKRSNPPVSDPVNTDNQASENMANQTEEKNSGESTQSTGQTGNRNDPTEQTEENNGNDSTKEMGESAVTLTHKISFIRGDKSELTGAIDIGTGKLLNYETCKEFFESGVTNNSLTYSKEFFNDHSLLLIGVGRGSGSAIMEVSEVKYKDGSVFCFLEYPTNGDILHNADVTYWYCLIEVDEVLPEGTRVVYYGESVTYSLDAYYEKQTQFNAQCVK